MGEIVLVVQPLCPEISDQCRIPIGAWLRQSSFSPMFLVQSDSDNDSAGEFKQMSTVLLFADNLHLVMLVLSSLSSNQRHIFAASCNSRVVEDHRELLSGNSRDPKG
jgi:hypothetical protein